MIFFTDISTDASQYCLLNINKLNNKRCKNKKMFFIDPGVYELTKQSEYSNRDLAHQIIREGLDENQWISMDYPCDMVKRFDWDKYWRDHCRRMGLNYRKDVFKLTRPVIEQNHSLEYTYIQRSYFNNRLYQNNNQYICTIQMHFESYLSFEFEAERLRPIWEKEGKIIGIGNMCRIMRPNKFTDQVFNYIKNNMKGKWVHVYGMPLAQIKKYAKMLEDNGIKLSVDSTKWTRAVTDDLKKRHGVSCRKDQRDNYFVSYIEQIRLENIEVIY